MLRTAVLVVVLVSVCAALEPPIEQLGPQLQCPTPKNTHVKVTMRTQQNHTGHWVSRVAVKQAMGLLEGGESDHWKVDVEQNTYTCEDEGSVLETAFYLTAPPPIRGTLRTSPVITKDPKPGQWVCPGCVPCPSCPLPPSCPSTPTTPPPSQATPPGYSRFLGIGIYKLHLNAATWVNAKAICEEEEAHLVVINSDKEADIMQVLMNLYPTVSSNASNNAYVYAGAYRIGNKYSTVLGGYLSETGYERWARNEPSGGNEFCLSLVRPTSQFNDVPCGFQLAFICEHPISN